MDIGDQGNVKSEINVTPLVDVCLVLLIIFMVVTPLLTGGPVQLPKTQNPSKKPEERKQLSIGIGTGHPAAYYFGESSKPMPKELLAQTLDEEYQRDPSRPVVLKADSHLSWGDVKEVMKLSKDAGFESVALIADKITPAAGGR